MKSEQLLNEADRCVKCGLCLPSCPTYRLTRDEGDSPRGRISLIQALVGGSVNSPALHRHLDRCLGCLACESACPSGVKYGRLIDSVRARQPHNQAPVQRLLYALISRLPYQPGIRPMIRLYQRSGISRLLRGIAGERFQRMDRLLPELGPHPEGWREVYSPADAIRGRVGLFTGCVGRITDQPALLATIRVLTSLGLEVTVPRGQVCCGALHLHNGQPGGAARLATANRLSFDGHGLEAVVHVASGCGIQLSGYDRIGGALDARVADICAFLQQSELLSADSFKPLRSRVLVHTPCSMRHPSGGSDSAPALLNLIPGLDSQSLADVGCCGAAGSYLLKQPGMADRLRTKTLDAIQRFAPDMLLTSNTGCALHIRAGLRQLGSPLEVRHPIELISQQLQAAPPPTGPPG